MLKFVTFSMFAAAAYAAIAPALAYIGFQTAFAFFAGIGNIEISALCVKDPNHFECFGKST